MDISVVIGERSPGWQGSEGYPDEAGHERREYYNEQDALHEGSQG
jgi:hypothetical protein